MPEPSWIASLEGMSFDFSERPFIVIWEVTRACGLACRHCRAAASLDRHPLELNHKESLHLIDEVARCRPALFVLTGGDPIRRQDLPLLIRHAVARSLPVSLSPSATPEFAATPLEPLKAAGIQRLSLSLDGASRQTHDRFRGIPGTWDWTMEILDHAAQVGLPIQINTTFTRQNLGEFDDFVLLLHDLRPVLWSVFQLVPVGRGTTEDMLSADEMEDLFQRLARLAGRAPFDIKTTEGQHYRRVLRQQEGCGRNGVGPRAPLGINDGKGFVFVSHLGNIQPSGFLPLSAGNVRRDGLLETYQRSPMFQALRDPSQLRGKCGRCEFKSICGGSRARAYAVTGDYLAEEPLCVYQPACGEGRSRESMVCRGESLRR